MIIICAYSLRYTVKKGTLLLTQPTTQSTHTLHSITRSSPAKIKPCTVTHKLRNYPLPLPPSHPRPIHPSTPEKLRKRLNPRAHVPGLRYTHNSRALYIYTYTSKKRPRAHFRALHYICIYLYRASRYNGTFCACLLASRALYISTCRRRRDDYDEGLGRRKVRVGQHKEASLSDIALPRAEDEESREVGSSLSLSLFCFLDCARAAALIVMMAFCVVGRERDDGNFFFFFFLLFGVFV